MRPVLDPSHRVRKLITIAAGDSIIAAARKMSRRHIGCLIVTGSGGRMVGILTERDLLTRVLTSSTPQVHKRVKDVMNTKVFSCPPGALLHEIQAIMDRQQIRHLPIVEAGKPIGIVSARDVMASQLNADRDMRNLTIFGMAKSVESRDSETGRHIDRVCSYAVELCRQLTRQRRFASEIDTDFLDLLRTTSPLHDIGKVGIPDCVLLKPGRLDDNEFEIMKAHARMGADMLDSVLRCFPNARFLRMGQAIAAWHHERFDGKGYPDGLSGEQIPLCARIFSVADVYDALVTRRVYKDAFSHRVARSIIADGSRTQFDPAVVQAMLRCEKKFVAIQQQYEDVRVAA
jgi:response regulator RpfG family c-di-GMP phosphodiesterase